LAVATSKIKYRNDDNKSKDIRKTFLKLSKQIQVKNKKYPLSFRYYYYSDFFKYFGL
jgi:predicted nucleic-acid-binding Zn-ribbon protein